MAGTIQIKRSANTANPSTLEFGELAWSSNGQILTIGREKADTSNTIAIGGARAPGTLTANQALVANATSEINEVKAEIESVISVDRNSISGKVSNIIIHDFLLR